MRKALAADLEEALAEDITRNSPKSLIPGNSSIKTNGSRHNEITPRSVDSMESQSNERAGLNAFESRHAIASKAESSTQAQWNRPSAPKVPTLWSHGETPRAETISSFLSNSHSTSDINFGDDPLKNPSAASGWIAINPESSGQQSNTHKSSPDTASAIWTGSNVIFSNSDRAKSQDVLASSLRSSLRDRSAEPLSTGGGSSASGAYRTAPEPAQHSDGGSRTNTISPMEVCIPARTETDAVTGTGWAPAPNSRLASSGSSVTSATGTAAGGGGFGGSVGGGGGTLQNGLPVLRHSSSSSFVPIRGGGGGNGPAPAGASQYSSAVSLEGGRGSGPARQARALSDPARGSYLEEFAAASHDLKTANDTIAVQRQLIQKLEARYTHTPPEE
jgi:hypothetical protein